MSRLNKSDDHHLIVNGSCLTDATCSIMSDFKNMRLFATVYASLLARYMMQAQLVMNVKKKSAVDVLDVGCGNGAAIRLWASQNFSTIARKVGIRYTGLDMFKPALEEANKNNPVGKAYIHSCEFVFQDLSKKWSTVKDNSQDIIWFTEVIEHVPVNKAQHTVNECYRVARKYGKMMISTPAPLYDKLVWPEAHTHEFKREETEKMLLKAGWKILDVWGVGVNWSKAKKKLRVENRPAYDMYETLRNRVGPSFAKVAMQALHPEVCDDLCWLCEK